MSTVRPLRILHISDLHERAAFDGMPAARSALLEWDARERGQVLGEKFLNTVKEIARTGVDLVCFTGDLADWGYPSEYAVATQRLDAILTAASVPRSRFFAVPGNHDVQRRLGKDAWNGIRNWLREVRDTPRLGRWFALVDHAPFGTEEKWKEEVLSRTAAFWQWLDEFKHSDLRPRSTMPLGYRQTIPVGTLDHIGVPVHVIGLDSAWLCGNEYDQGNIVITEEQVQAHIRGGEAPLVGFRIALVHHPLHYLLDSQSVWALLADEGVDILLHGHQHTVLAAVTEVPGASLRVLAAGCLMEGELGKGWPNEFHLIEVSLSAVAPTYTVHFRKWARDAAPRFWARGSDIYAQAADGALCWDTSGTGRVTKEAVAAPRAVAGGVNTQFGLTATPMGFRRSVGNLVRLYLGTETTPVPFGGREREIGALNAWLHGRVEGATSDVLLGDSQSNNLLITAPAGRGKTTLLMRWIHQLDTAWSLVFVPVSIRAETNQALSFYQAFAARLAEILGEVLLDPRSDPAAYYRDKVVEYLDRVVEKGKRCLVVIDGLDEARGWKIDTTVLPLTPPPGLKIVISARQLAGDKRSENWLARLGWTPPASARTLEVQPLSREGIADVLRKMDFPVASLSADVDIIEELYRLTEGGDPLVLHFYANDLLKKGEEAARLTPRDLHKLKPGFGAYFKRWMDEQRAEWTAVGSPVDDDLVDAMMAVLASAYGPIRLRDLEELVSCVLPAQRIFTVRTIDPLRRFILGDGFETGYSLAHPKLADYLQRDYFGGGKILEEIQRAFVEWMREVVQGLNDGRRSPSDTPPYVLLFYTQHLNAMPGKNALLLFRELVENGWRLAWEHHEGGYQGFSRDINLAARAFRAAVADDPEAWKRPRTGLGALVRCSLCLSSIRSIGLAVPGEVLAEFLRGASISPNHALYLAHLKKDKDRPDTIKAIVSLLPPELRSEAYAATRDIVSPKIRFEALMAIADHLADRERENAYLEALHVSKRIEKDFERFQALRELRPFLEDCSTWTEAYSAEEKRYAADNRRAAAELGAREQPESNSALAWKMDTAARAQWIVKASRPDLTPDQMRELLELGRDEIGLNGLLKKHVIISLAPRLPEDLHALAVDVVLHGRDNLFRGETLLVLVPHLSSDLLEAAFRTVLETLNYDIEMSLVALAQRLDIDGRNRALDSVFAMEDDYRRGKALGAIAPYLTPQMLDRAVRFSLETGGDYGSWTYLSTLAPYLTTELLAKTLSFARDTPDPDERARVLRSVASNLHRNLLPEGLKLAAEIPDLEKRGQVLAQLLPRLRAENLTTAVSDAHALAFVIGDSHFRALARASLIPDLDEENAQHCIAELPRDHHLVARNNTSETDRAIAMLVLVLVSAHLPDTEATRMLSQVVGIARQIKESEERAFVLCVLAAHLPEPLAGTVRKEAVEAARVTSAHDAGIQLMLLSTLVPENQAGALLDEAHRALEGCPSENARKSAQSFNCLVSALMSGGTAREKQTALAEAAASEIGDDVVVILRDLAALWVLLLSPALTEDTDGLIRDALAAVEEVRDGERLKLMGLAAMASYLPLPHLSRCVLELLETAARLPRPAVLGAVALVQGVANEVLRGNPVIAGNRIPGSPIVRLGGRTAVIETEEAIRDVCRWWP